MSVINNYRDIAYTGKSIERNNSPTTLLATQNLPHQTVA
jgi:hypothetical protein